MLPLRDDNPVRRPPVVTWVIVGLCVAVYLFWQPTPFGENATDHAEDTEFNVRHAAIPCEVTQGRPLTVDELSATFQQGDDAACGAGSPSSPTFDPGKNVYLAVLVSMFLHGSLIHLGGNLLFLWVFGNNVEDRLGKLGYLLFYLSGGVIAALAHVAVRPDSTVPVVGASGAIAAVMGAYLVWFPNVRVRTLIIFYFVTLFDIRAKWVLAFWFVLQFFTSPRSGVAWVAHVGGFAFGVVVGLAALALGIGDGDSPARPAGSYPPGWPPGDDRRFGGRY